MKRDKKKLSATLDQHLRLFNAPSVSDLERSHARGLKRLQAPDDLPKEVVSHRPSRGKQQRWMLLVAATLACVIVVTTFVLVYSRPAAVVESADGGLYRIV